MPYIIQDWAGNRIEPQKTFKTFEDAWSFIDSDLTDRLGLKEEDYQEYEVIQTVGKRFHNPRI